MTIRVGIGGWTYEPWRGTFYPEGLKHARELYYASRAVTTIEVNGTFYRTQTPKTFRSWADQVPDGFVFALKAVRYATNRRVLAEAGDSVAAFVNSGLVELGDKLGPINWQFAPTKRFDPDDFGAFLALLPDQVGGVRLRHAVEVRHESFCCAEFVALARKHAVAVVIADSPDYPALGDLTADFVYARLQDAKAEIATGYDDAALGLWRDRARGWETGAAAEGLPTYGATAARSAAHKGARDVFLYMINGAKERAPAAAMALIARL
ncbi:DUF72 domain-containing protein [Aquabacter spiritensis]|uniref:Uncharacterized protein YecE (DUF72 family) n=1 Tax=Aquabacter spiritensis TaxID=933073 RepID=A0A4R3M352_9HYPH|nr:DUF72 domain-containing protein [Aquabacter spiritensis]TCT05585.1 uncharacterized protein YecE (DUF72 family) [Aquabacter spiritensis]